MTTISQGPVGIGGWLHLFAIHIVISPLGNFMGSLKIGRLLEKQNSSNGWLTFHLWESRLFVVVFLVVAILFFTKNKLFPKVYAGTCIALGVSVFIGAQETASQFHLDSFQQIVFYVGAIGIPYATVVYLLKSQRVKNTFVR